MNHAEGLLGTDEVATAGVATAGQPVSQGQAAVPGQLAWTFLVAHQKTPQTDCRQRELQAWNVGPSKAAGVLFPGVAGENRSTSSLSSPGIQHGYLCAGTFCPVSTEPFLSAQWLLLNRGTFATLF